MFYSLNPAPCEINRTLPINSNRRRIRPETYSKDYLFCYHQWEGYPWLVVLGDWMVLWVGDAYLQCISHIVSLIKSKLPSLALQSYRQTSKSIFVALLKATSQLSRNLHGGGKRERMNVGFWTQLHFSKAPYCNSVSRIQNPFLISILTGIYSNP